VLLVVNLCGARDDVELNSEGGALAPQVGAMVGLVEPTVLQNSTEHVPLHAPSPLIMRGQNRAGATVLEHWVSPMWRPCCPRYRQRVMSRPPVAVAVGAMAIPTQHYDRRESTGLSYRSLLCHYVGKVIKQV
jgi:hypothetical protein